jgi:cytidyltransferase-like protein
MSIKKIKIGYIIGRFNPLHLGHKFMIDTMISENDFTIILVGSANVSRTDKNPLTYSERAHLLTHLYPNTIVLPLNDFSDESLWIHEVDRKINECINTFNLKKENTEINLYTGGIGKGEDSQLRDTWCKPLGHNAVPINLSEDIYVGLSATKIRDHFYREEMDAIENLIPEKVYHFLNDFRQHQDFQSLKSKRL